MTMEKPELEFVEIDLEADITCVSSCVDTAQRAGYETCGCTDGYKDGATGADEPDCDEGVYEW